MIDMIRCCDLTAQRWNKRFTATSLNLPETPERTNLTVKESNSAVNRVVSRISVWWFKDQRWKRKASCPWKRLHSQTQQIKSDRSMCLWSACAERETSFSMSSVMEAGAQRRLEDGCRLVSCRFGLQMATRRKGRVLVGCSGTLPEHSVLSLIHMHVRIAKCISCSQTHESNSPV